MDNDDDKSKHNLYNIKIPFPFKLHEMLSDAVRDGNERIVSWQPHGKAFRVHKPGEFADKIMKNYFHQSQYKSFQRQLHIYGFHRISKGLDKGAYYHPKFLLGEKTTSLRMTRRKIKGSVVDEEIEDPDFYQAMTAPLVGPSFVKTPVRGRPQMEFNSAPPPSSRDVNPRTSKSEDNIFPLSMSESKIFQKQPKGEEQKRIAHIAPVDRRPGKMILRDDFQLPKLLAINQFVDDFAPLTLPIKPLVEGNQQLLLLPLSCEQNRQGNIYGESDEVFFAGRKFHIVQNPMLLSLLQGGDSRIKHHGSAQSERR